MAITPLDIDFDAGTIRVDETYPRIEREDVFGDPKTLLKLLLFVRTAVAMAVMEKMFSDSTSTYNGNRYNQLFAHLQPDYMITEEDWLSANPLTIAVD